jgi:hypothetical protein
VISYNRRPDQGTRPADCVIAERPLTIAALPDLLPAVLEPTYDQLLPALLGGDVIALPAQMPTGLPATAVRDLAAALTPERAPAPPAPLPSHRTTGRWCPSRW